MSAWILIVIFGSSGFTAEFADQQACESARQHVLSSTVSGYVERYSRCLPKNSKKEPTK